MFYLTTHSTHFIYGYMASDIWLRTILIVRKETRCRHIGYSFRLAARVLLYATSHRQDNTYNGHCYTSRGALAGTRNSSMGPPHEGSIRRPIAPWANALPLSYVPLPSYYDYTINIDILLIRRYLRSGTAPSYTRRCPRRTAPPPTPWNTGSWTSHAGFGSSRSDTDSENTRPRPGYKCRPWNLELGITEK